MDFASTEVFPQIVLVLIITAVIYILFICCEQVYKLWVGYSTVKVPILTVTSNSSSGQKTFLQDPNMSGSSAYLPLLLSENQLTGIEFSYTTFIYIHPDSDDGTNTFKTVFYKGYETTPFPLLGPGVFVSAANATNAAPTLRIVMNSYESWFNHVDVEQITFGKWLHLALVLRKNALEVYVNGNLAKKASFKGTLPYQNYQPLVLFPNSVAGSGQILTAQLFDNSSGGNTSKQMGIPPGENMSISGKFSGYISNMYYFGYAITYSEIQAMMAMGPSPKFDQTNMDTPPYLIDSWWTNQRA
jgi:hypothetical protein